MLPFVAPLVDNRTFPQPAVPPSAHTPHLCRLADPTSTASRLQADSPTSHTPGSAGAIPAPPSSAPAQRALSIHDSGAVDDGGTADSVTSSGALDKVNGTTPTLLLIPPGRCVLTDTRADKGTPTASPSGASNGRWNDTLDPAQRFSEDLQIAHRQTATHPERPAP